MNRSITGCTENIRGFLGRKPVMKKTGSCISAYFDVSWGLNDPESNKYGTWRHCIAYNLNAEKIKNCNPGTFFVICGWVVTNPVYDEYGRKQIIDNKPVTREYLVVDTITIIDRDRKQENKQLRLVESG
jgi:hypothetical protein